MSDLNCNLFCLDRVDSGMYGKSLVWIKVLHKPEYAYPVETDLQINNDYYLYHRKFT